jgi:hypothetical protein
LRGIELLPAPAAEEPMQGIKHLPAPAHQEQVQGIRWIEHLRRIAHQRAPAGEAHVQGMRGIEHLQAPAVEEQLQEVRRTSRCSQCWRSSEAKVGRPIMTLSYEYLLPSRCFKSHPTAQTRPPPCSSLPQETLTCAIARTRVWGIRVTGFPPTKLAGSWSCLP